MTNKKAIIYASELEFLSLAIMDYPDIETGGDIFGMYTRTGVPVVQYIIGPGSNASHNVAFFRQDLEYLQSFGDTLSESHGIQHLGSWHSHHRLGLAVPSSHDSLTMANAVEKNGLSQFLMILGNIPNNGQCTIKGFLYDKFNGTDYHEIEWIVLKGKSPIRSVTDQAMQDIIYKPACNSANIIGLRVAPRESDTRTRGAITGSSWLSSNKGKQHVTGIIRLIGDSIDTGIKMKLTSYQSIAAYIKFRGKEFVLLLHGGQTTRILTLLNNEEQVMSLTVDPESYDAEVIFNHIKSSLYAYAPKVSN